VAGRRVVAAHDVVDVEPVRPDNKPSGGTQGVVTAHGVGEVEPVRPDNKPSSGARRSLCNRSLMKYLCTSSLCTKHIGLELSGSLPCALSRSIEFLLVALYVHVDDFPCACS
jgi:hypothetical protein